MDTTKADLLLIAVAYSAFVGVVILAVALAVVARQVARVRREQRANEQAVLARLDSIEQQQTRQATNLAGLTTRVDSQMNVLSAQVGQIANRDQTEQIVQAQVQNLGLMLMGLRPPLVMNAGQAASVDGRAGGVDFHGPVDVRGGVAGHDIGRIEDKGGTP